MAFKTPQYEFEQVKRAVEEQYAPHDRDKVYSILEPFTENGARLPLCILHLAQGRIADVKHFAECARKDYRDVIFWAENPDEAAVDTPEKMEDFQRILKWAGQERDTALDLEKARLIECRGDQKQNRPWWKFW